MSDHVTPPTDERIKELRRKLSLPERMDGNDWFDIGAILDDYSSLRAENERIRGEHQNLDCDAIRAIRPMYKRLTARAEKAEAELAVVRKAREDYWTEWKKAEAELMRAEDRHHVDLMELHAQEADVQKSIHLSKSVEEAMGRISEIMEDRIHSMQSHASVYGSDRESAQMMAEANSLSESLAVIRAALGL